MVESESNTPEGQGRTKGNTKNSQQGSQAGTGASITKQNTESSHCNYQPQPQPKWWQRIDWSQAVLDLLLLAVGIKLACIYSGQLSQMIESNKISRESLQSVQRAFLKREVPNGWSWNAEGKKVMKFHAEWTNIGPTPALETIVYFNISPQPDAPTEDEFIGITPSTKFAPTVITPQEGAGSEPIEIPESLFNSQDHAGSGKHPKIFQSHNHSIVRVGLGFL